MTANKEMMYYDVMIVSPEEYGKGFWNPDYILLEYPCDQIRAEDQDHADFIVANGIAMEKFHYSARAVLSEGQVQDDTYQVDLLLAMISEMPHANQ